MTQDPTALRMQRALIEAATDDPRIVGLLSDGSHSRGEADLWSDVDVSLFVADAAFAEFTRDWMQWAGQFGHLLLAYISWVGHPWAVYDAEPVPLRVDLDLHPASDIPAVCDWTATAISVEAMLWYDGSGGQLRSCVEQLVGRSLAPRDLQAAFEQSCGDLWYELLYAFGQVQRGQEWRGRQAFHCRVMEPLLRLLRIEAGAVERWQAAPAALNVDTRLSIARRTQLDACIPANGEPALRAALASAAQLGRDVCQTIASRHGWPWPSELADPVTDLLHP